VWRIRHCAQHHRLQLPLLLLLLQLLALSLLLLLSAVVLAHYFLAAVCVYGDGV
jgi:hypothetical protein